MRSVLVCAAALALLAGCDRIAGNAPEPAVQIVETPDLSPFRMQVAEIQAAAVDRSTPQLALQAWWSRQDALFAVGCAWSQATYGHDKAMQLHEEIEAAYHAGLTGDALARRQEHEQHACIVRTYERTIENARVEAARAVIRARIKNVTPIPEGTTLRSYALQMREQGDLYCYTLSDVEGQWKVSKVESYHAVSRSWIDHTPPEPFNRAHEYAITIY